MSPKDKGDYAEGKWLRNRRRANGLKQQQVAARLNERNQGRISEWENGVKPIPPSVMKELEALLGKDE